MKSDDQCSETLDLSLPLGDYSRQKVVELLKMLKFVAKDWLIVLNILRDFRNADNPVIVKAIVDGKDLMLIDSLKFVSDFCQKLGMEVSYSHLQVVLNKTALQFVKAKNGSPQVYSPQDFTRDMEALAKMFVREIELRVFLTVDPKKIQYFEKDKLLGESVSLKFPSADFDISEAGNCFALARWTACVFHLMRVLEKGIRALALDLNVPYKAEAWGGIIKDIEKEIVTIQKSTKAHPKRANLKFYSESVLEFRYFKDAWRNHAMHSSVAYSADDALKIMNHVRDFMQHLSLHLSE